ncbi:MAG: hypothetical protein QM809_02920 [Gordonia sp. (in: high G+C Gram-positive bacteria)]|uniref:hypothetical protein n=1 Tax=Gordonia sp. (in: high G+C Gram-positive bacteria) TaxID=84139 RepID=UPI0039E399F1
MTLLMRAKKRADSAAVSLSHGIGRPHDGVVTRFRFTMAFLLPALIAGVSIGAGLEPQIGPFISGMSVMSGVLLAISGIAYGRVKDLANEGRGDGVDPMAAAYRFARGAMSAAAVSLTTSGMLILQLIFESGTVSVLLFGTSLALITHLGARIFFMLGAMRHQLEATAGSRSAQRPNLRKAS